jgi:hypothetical protein
MAFSKEIAPMMSLTRKVFVFSSIVIGVSLATAQTPPPDRRYKEPATAVVDATTAGKHTPGMHMHKSDIVHRGGDADVAKEFQGEAAELRELAASHRKLAEQYRTRTPVKGQGNYANVAAHCERLAKAYEDAAKAAEAASAELGKK